MLFRKVLKGTNVEVAVKKDSNGHRVSYLFSRYQLLKSLIENHTITIADVHKELQSIFHIIGVKYTKQAQWFSMPIHMGWSFDFCYGSNMTWAELEDSFDRAFTACSKYVIKECNLDNLNPQIALKCGFGVVELEGKRFFLIPRYYAPSLVEYNTKREIRVTNIPQEEMWTNKMIAF